MTRDTTDGYDSMPSRTDAPQTCQYAGCETNPTRWIHFSESPDEYLCYCEQHCFHLRGEPDAKSSGPIR